MSHIPTWSHDVVLEPEPASASRARDFVRRHLAEHQLWYLADDVGLVVGELAANAVTHARTAFTVSVHDDHDCVLLTVCDQSPELARRINADAMDTSGRGLAIVDALSRSWGVTNPTDASKSVWASFPTLTGQEIAPIK